MIHVCDTNFLLMNALFATGVFYQQFQQTADFGIFLTHNQRSRE
jgi:hypothetical protein